MIDLVFTLVIYYIHIKYRNHYDYTKLLGEHLFLINSIMFKKKLKTVSSIASLYIKKKKKKYIPYFTDYLSRTTSKNSIPIAIVDNVKQNFDNAPRDHFVVNLN